MTRPPSGRGPQCDRPAGARSSAGALPAQHCRLQRMRRASPSHPVSGVFRAMDGLPTPPGPPRRSAGGGIRCCAPDRECRGKGLILPACRRFEPDAGATDVAGCVCAPVQQVFRRPAFIVSQRDEVFVRGHRWSSSWLSVDQTLRNLPSARKFTVMEY
jgi:hypothetical protein